MYVRSPGGILVECTSNVPGGFFLDESPDELGTRLHLPPWYEEQHADIVAMLEPLRVPEESQSRVGPTRSVPVPMPVSRPSAAVTLSRTRPEFINDRK
jgi:hypothetical protein